MDEVSITPGVTITELKTELSKVTQRLFQIVHCVANVQMTSRTRGGGGGERLDCCLHNHFNTFLSSAFKNSLRTVVRVSVLYQPITLRFMFFSGLTTK
jgi:hypothetical protein